MADEDKLFSEVIENHSQPLLFKGAVDDWPALKWTSQFLSEQTQNKTFRCKINERDDSVFPEKEHMHVLVTLKQYNDWLSGVNDDKSPLKHVNPDEYSCYISYKHMKDMFDNCPHLLKDLHWDRFGLSDRTGEEGTIWLGSAGAYTPCHQDSYGFNLVTQITGCKRWFLFDPCQTKFMYPTRIPYEESSVFSEVNILKPNLRKHKLFKQTTANVIDLSPGDTLYVPRHWWHFVQCRESSISINTWIPLKDDLCSHVSESVTRFLMSTFYTAIPQMDLATFLDPNEELTAPDTSLNYIDMALRNIHAQTDSKIKMPLPSTKNSSTVDINKARDQNSRSKDEEDNFQKFKIKFQDLKVLRLCKCCCLSASIQSKIKSDESYSPHPKKIKMCQCLVQSGHESLTRQVEIFCIKRLTFIDYLSLLNDLGQDLEETCENTSDTDDEPQSDQTLTNDSSMGSQERKKFLHGIVNAILKPNVIEQISFNILNK